MSKNFGFDLLREQLTDHLAAEVALSCATMERVDNYGTTPIERLLLGAIFLRLRYVKDTWNTQCVIVPDERVERFKAGADGKNWLVVQKQPQLPNWRPDFIFHAHASWRRNPGGGSVGWKRLIVECDGHDFHERTKEQAAKDRSRDREAQESGYEIFRFTGSELWKDPIGCARQVIEWAESKL